MPAESSRKDAKTQSNEPALFCPMCGLRMAAKDKVRKGDQIHHRYDCENESCPARQDGYIVSADTVEVLLRYRRRPINSICRTKRNKVPALGQMTLASLD
jgi:hypothetical protein